MSDVQGVDTGLLAAKNAKVATLFLGDSMTLIKFELHQSITTEISALELLQLGCLEHDLSLSKAQIKQVMQKGAVWLTDKGKTKRLRRAKTQLQVGQELHLYYNEAALSDDFVHPQLISDCGDYSVWYKPSGMMSQGSKWGDHSTIARFAELNLTPQRPAFLVHRLDRATQGIILVAHSRRGVRELTALFEQRNITKKYQAVINGHFDGVKTYKTDIDGRSAYTKATLLRYNSDNDYSLLDVEIGTGRKHQIRKHLSEDGFAIVGDRLYGDVLDNADYDLQLCAYHLSFNCPLSDKAQQFEVKPQLLLSKE
ncbi:RNA pseudouridine synthase [Psychrobium sp. MM17-31]|uniref:RluA family pseudouridine synthase n=1 Tax=Psychrobium sp. MM17-31 TaxID=2917758 RepID=UPI001EF69DBD|nr:RNA pseudouridine synthase [Psychrobium sp. MM17-31]